MSMAMWVLLVLVTCWAGLQWSWWGLSFFEFHHVDTWVSDHEDAKLDLAIEVVIIGKNEDRCIGRTVKLWGRQFGVQSVIVLDDGSTDGTRQEVMSAGGDCISNQDLWIGGKPGAMAWWGRNCSDLREVVYVFADADNVPTSPMTAIRLARAAWYHGVAQCQVRGIGGNWLQDILGVERAAAWAVLESGRCRFGASAYLGGSGWAITGELLSKVDFPSDSVCDDLAYSLALAGLGLHIPYLEHVVVEEQMPATFRVLWRQRLRWARGTWQCVFSSRMVGAMVGEEWFQGWFLLIGQTMMLVFVFSLWAATAIAPESLGRMLVGISGLSMVFASVGAMRVHRWRGVLGYMVIWAVNLAAFIAGLLSWHSMNWVPTLHKGKNG